VRAVAECTPVVLASSDVSIIGNSIRFSGFCTLINFFSMFSRLVITSFLCTTVFFTLAIVLKFYVNCS
jgi:hypothetical protein